MIQKAAKQYLSDIHWKVKATKCVKWMLNVSQDAETLFLYKNKFHTFDEVTNSTFFYKDNVDDETEPDNVRDDPEIPTVPTIPITTTESPENLPSVGATYEDTFML